MPRKTLEERRAYAREWRAANPEKCRAYAPTQAASSKAWRKRNPDKVKQMVRNANLQKSHGITQQDYEEMLLNQGGVCAICEANAPGVVGRSFYVDHCHVTTLIRGLLCHYCNVGLGHFKDSPSLLRRAAEYLECEPYRK